MDLKDYLAILWRRKWFLIVTLFLTVSVNLFIVTRETPIYIAYATLRVVTGSNGGANVDYGETLYAERLQMTYAALLTTEPVLSQMRAQLGITPTEDPHKIHMGFVAKTELMQVTVEDPDPQFAAKVANSLAEIMVDESRKNRTGRAYTVSFVEAAEPPTTPSKPSKVMSVIVALMAGGVAGLGLMLFFENIDTRLYAVADVEKVTDLPTLGRIPPGKIHANRPFFTISSSSGEAMRHLRTNLLAVAQQSRLHTLLLTSGAPRNGSSTLVANMAVSMAAGGLKVILVDADMRRPSLHLMFGLPNERGLSTLLQGEATLDSLLLPTSLPGVTLLPAGPPPLTPTELLGSPAMALVVQELASRCDMVLFDAPSVLGVSDATALATLVDGVLLVVRRKFGKKEELAGCHEHLGAVYANQIGVVVNDAEEDRAYRYYQQAAVGSKNPLESLRNVISMQQGTSALKALRMLQPGRLRNRQVGGPEEPTTPPGVAGGPDNSPPSPGR